QWKSQIPKPKSQQGRRGLLWVLGFGFLDFLMSDLFASKGPSPLADRMRPATLEEYVGQEEVLRAVEKLLSRPPSMILWGPPGCGKTTLSRLIAHKTGL